MGIDNAGEEVRQTIEFAQWYRCLLYNNHNNLFLSFAEEFPQGTFVEEQIG
jgi:hypothetical protein